MSRRIAVITGTRAEFGLLSGIITELNKRGATVQLVVTGTHLSAAHGHTVDAIEQEGFAIAAKVPIDLSDDSPLGTARSMAASLRGIADALASLKPDVVLILGDRYEMLAAAETAALLNIPIAHLHGGEITEGAVDDALRHAITKLSYWHLVANEHYAKRVRQLGEADTRIVVTGAPGLDQLIQLKTLSKNELEDRLGYALDKPLLLVTLHPETLSVHNTTEQVAPLIDALGALSDIEIQLTGANADAGGNTINHALQDFAKRHAHVHFTHSLGRELYINAMRVSAVMVGNSSSGVIEAPVLALPSVNIGDRQKGRVFSESVIDVANNAVAIKAGIEKALAPGFKSSLKPDMNNGKPGEICATIATHLLQVALPENLRKPFVDI